MLHVLLSHFTVRVLPLRRSSRTTKIWHLRYYCCHGWADRGGTNNFQPAVSARVDQSSVPDFEVGVLVLVPRGSTPSASSNDSLHPQHVAHHGRVHCPQHHWPPPSSTSTRKKPKKSDEDDNIKTSNHNKPSTKQ